MHTYYGATHTVALLAMALRTKADGGVLARSACFDAQAQRALPRLAEQREALSLEGPRRALPLLRREQVRVGGGLQSAREA